MAVKAMSIATVVLAGLLLVVEGAPATQTNEIRSMCSYYTGIFVSPCVLDTLACMEPLRSELNKHSWDS